MAKKSKQKVKNTAAENDEDDEDEMEKEEENETKAAVPVPEGQDTLWENFIEIFDPEASAAPSLPSSSSSNSSSFTKSARFYMNKAVPYFFLRPRLERGTEPPS
eukprot:evm.model.NODE_50951_length_58533_cov_30.382143.5